MPNLPSFLIIGSMKSATTTLYDQLNRQEGIFLPELKEPNFYSNDEIYNRGFSWYESLFQNANEQDIIGEASTHYTKYPTYPDTVNRLVSHNPGVQLIYVIRHPIERLISQYIHQWTENIIKVEINEAIHEHLELIEYSKYYHQLSLYLSEFKQENILIVFFESIIASPQSELNKICKFIGYDHDAKWHELHKQKNKSSERVRKFPFYELLVESQIATTVRRNYIPKSFRNKVKSNFQMKQRPVITDQNIRYLKDVFNEDLLKLGKLIGDVNLDCDNFKDVAKKMI